MTIVMKVWSFLLLFGFIGLGIVVFIISFVRYTNKQVSNLKDKMTQNEKEKSYFKRFSEEQQLKIKDLEGALKNESVARKFAELEANLAAEEKSKLEELLKKYK